ncbi:MAG: imidazole glycerol phosphate synthase subunit HisH [Chloroflexi bacterium]|nr:imidazole glycerol phosphate synthase subunit HisH [Chloroflexota bacterium]
MIVIIDYGMGNLGSILNRLERMETEVIISSKAEQIEKADKLILPGVGSFAAGIDNLKKRDLIGVLEKKIIIEKAPILGICLGMQLFTRRSEEGDAEGLGWVDAETRKFNFTSEDAKLRIPHMGWNSINKLRDSLLLVDLPDGASFYFVHSYYVQCNDPGNVVATTRYGIDFACVIQKANIFGTQFHPEKSHQDGIVLLRNFIERI